MSLSTLPLSYCTNVHPGLTVAEVEAGLDRFTVPVHARFGRPLAAGLWLAEPVVRELTARPEAAAEFAARLRSRGLTCHTLNAFPYGNFHSTRVKENVYLPDWTQPERLDYTTACARLLAEFLTPDVDGSISTVPLGFKGFQAQHPPDFLERCIAALLEQAERLSRLESETGRRIRLAVEPEPLCILETTAETLAFFDRIWQAAERRGSEAVARRHLGVCYDVCHQSVEFEDVAASIRQLHAAGVRINKVHVSCAIQLDDPRDAAARSELAAFVEPRYLHQTLARQANGEVLRWLDLSPELTSQPSAEYLAAAPWRIHFHVPVDAESLGRLRTTRPDLRRALRAVAALDYAPHLEVETYTWPVLPGQSRDLVSGLASELASTTELLDEVRT